MEHNALIVLQFLKTFPVFVFYSLIKSVVDMDNKDLQTLQFKTKDGISQGYFEKSFAD